MNIEQLIVDEMPVYDGTGFSNRLPTGIITLDIALGNGIPFNGAMIHLFGAESSGKTSLAYRLCKKVTDVGGYITWFDSESSYDPEWSKIQGLSPESTICYRIPYKEKVMQTIVQDIFKYREKFLPWLDNPKWVPSKEDYEESGFNSRQIDQVKEYLTNKAPYHTIVWDSISASPVKSAYDGEDQFSQGMAYEARLHKAFCKMFFSSVIGCDKINIIIINQVIDDIGSYGGGVTFSGGHALRHAIHLNLLVKKHGRGEVEEDGTTATDYVSLRIMKNKITPVTNIAFPVIFSKSRGYLGLTALLEYLLSIKYFTGTSWKKFTYKDVDKETGEILKEEEINFQMSKFYKLMYDRPELLKYLCEVVKDRFATTFPKTKSLMSSNLDEIINSCLNEETAVPNSVETLSELGVSDEE